MKNIRRPLGRSLSMLLLLVPALLLVMPATLYGQALDLIFANQSARNRVCLNDGSGSFTCSNVSGDTNQSFAMAVADVDGGTGLDLIFANSGIFGTGDNNRVCLNDGMSPPSFTCSIPA